MNTIINFELAKLLKEKDFKGKFWVEDYYNKSGKLFQNMKTSTYDSDIHIKAPTIAEIVMWLYDRHGIWISVERFSTLFRPYVEEISDKRFGKWEGHKYESPTKSYEAAIEYCLIKLI